MQSYVQAKQYADEADNSRAQMTAMVDAMTRINETSKNIENIISEIEDIASQTNAGSIILCKGHTRSPYVSHRPMHDAEILAFRIRSAPKYP